MIAEGFCPLVADWFQARFDAPTPAQARGWPAIGSGANTLISAPTGSGKTLAAFAFALDQLVRRAQKGELTDEVAVVYVSPLKALGNDVRANLEVPLAEIRELAGRRGQELPEIRVAVRSGDTPQHERVAMTRRPPHILVTTPESLYILLTAAQSRAYLSTATTVIVDEVHAVAQDKRGAHLALSLERLDRAAGRRLQRIGLSATQRPIEAVARLLVGAGQGPGPAPECAIVDTGHRRDWDLSVWVPSVDLGAVATHEMRGEVLDRVASLSTEVRSTIVFVNTRRMVERVAHQLTERLGPGRVAAHHGSLSRETRLGAETGLKTGKVPVVVATASLELGIDVGHVDLVCHIGAPRAIGVMLQRVGRSGHGVNGLPRGVLFPLTRDELLQCAACVRAARQGRLDLLVMREKPLDVLAQQLVAECAAQESTVDQLFEMARSAHPYRDLGRDEFEQLVDMLTEGVSTSRGRRSAWLHRDDVGGVARARRGARLAAITSGGAIPDTADYDVLEDPSDTFVGRVNEDFAIESMAGDVFLLGNTSWRIRRVESGRVRVVDAAGLPPTVPFWNGEAPARTPELSMAVSELREEVAADPAGAGRLLGDECGLDASGAEQVRGYIAETVATLGAVPTRRRVIAERFFDESGGMQLILHAPFGAGINRAWGLALRKRFCVTFDFELQAAATDEGIVLSLGEQHSFPLAGVLGFVRAGNVHDALQQAVLQAPVFGTRFRWNAGRALALLRHQGGRRVPLPVQRMRSDDLLAAVFPDQVACQDNHGGGPIIPPDHPLVNETMRDCLTEWMDTPGLVEVLRDLEAGVIETLAVETPMPSPMSHEILNANPYAFLDDAPLEERRARAVALRRIDPDLALGPGRLSESALAEVREQARPVVRDQDELHDLLLTVVLLPLERAAPWMEWTEALVDAGRCVRASWCGPDGTGRHALVATELARAVTGLHPGMTLSPAPTRLRRDPSATDPETLLNRLVQGWMESLGPVSVSELAGMLGLEPRAIERAMLALENSGVVLRGSFTPGVETEEWCDRRLLARIHRLTVSALRRETVAVTAAQYMQFLLGWQHLLTGTRLHGTDGLLQVMRQLQGLELPAGAWEMQVLPARVAQYAPADLEQLCLSGVLSWGRVSQAARDEDPEPSNTRRGAPSRATPITFVLREEMTRLLPAPARDAAALDLSTAARQVAAHLESRGASFLADMARDTGRLTTEVEDALWELVAAGLVTSDGVAGLRHLLGGHAGTRRSRRGAGLPAARQLPSGRWTRWRDHAEAPSESERAEAFARQLLRRYGVVFPELLARERLSPPWRQLARVLRLMEMRQEVRGGRFVSGFIGEQFALPEAVESMRAMRRSMASGEVVVVPAGDPCNLVGIVLPGPRVSPQSGMSIAYRDGEVEAIGPLGSVRSELDRSEQESRVHGRER
ncbi:MAG: DEAD/DEAH box helicase [Candidatus Dormibacteria bacterium]